MSKRIRGVLGALPGLLILAILVADFAFDSKGDPAAIAIAVYVGLICAFMACEILHRSLN